ncbi:MAG: hypothetical protein F9Y92_05885 [Thermoplasmatales archaeon]|jgi:translation initiation factor 2B subunit (eIF-2B alpha/beta/delta family)|nr:hypothetical protein [Thermoplasmatales archaeon]
MLWELSFLKLIRGMKMVIRDNISGSEKLTLEALYYVKNNFSERFNFFEKIKRYKGEMPEVIKAVYLTLDMKGVDDVDSLIKKITDAKENAINNSSSIFKKDDVVTTISYSSMVEMAIKRNSDKIVGVNVLESRPMFEGRLLAKSLASNGINVRLFTDASIYHALKGSTMTLVGMDALLKDFSLLHKVGTFPLALASREFSVPFYSIGHSFKFYDKKIKLRRHPPSEICEKGVNFTCINYYFDITPSRFITAYITDLGVFTKNGFRDLLNYF